MGRVSLCYTPFAAKLWSMYEKVQRLTPFWLLFFDLALAFLGFCLPLRTQILRRVLVRCRDEKTGLRYEDLDAVAEGSAQQEGDRPLVLKDGDESVGFVLWDGNGQNFPKSFPRGFQTRQGLAIMVVEVSLHTQCLREHGDFGKC